MVSGVPSETRARETVNDGDISMPIVFSCSQCQKPLQAPDGTEGRQVRCPNYRS